MDTHDIIEKILPELRKLQNYDYVSTSELMERVGIHVLDVDFSQMFDVQEAFVRAAKKEGIILDYSATQDRFSGVPFNLPAVVKHADAISTCIIRWEDYGQRCTDDLLCVETKILQNEIQVRFFSGEGLMHGQIWPLMGEQNHFIFRLLEREVQKWESNIIDMCDGFRWQIKMYARGKLVKTIEGNDAPPHEGQEIRNKIIEIIGTDNCYVFC